MTRDAETGRETERTSRIPPSWLQLFRLPNLLTVPGDPIAGCFLALGGATPDLLKLLPAVMASLLFYAAGLLLNDLADRKTDSEHAPERPLPSKAVSVRAVWVVCVLLFALGLGCCVLLQRTGLLMGIALLAAIVAYDTGGKKVPILGALLMGLCRSLSLLLGATQSGLSVTPVLPVAGFILIYVAAITVVGRQERVAPKRAEALSWMPALALACGLPLFRHVVVPGPAHQVVALVLYAAALASTIAAFTMVVWERSSAPQVVGLAVSVLVFIQAAFVLISSHSTVAWMVAVALAASWPLNRALAKYLYAS